MLLSHPDLAHAGALPYAYAKLGLRCPVFTTTAVARMAQLFVEDALEVLSVSVCLGCCAYSCGVCQCHIKIIIFKLNIMPVRCPDLLQARRGQEDFDLFTKAEIDGLFPHVEMHEMCLPYMYVQTPR